MPDHLEYRTPQILAGNPLREGETAHFHFDDFAANLARLIADKVLAGLMPALHSAE